ncbi:MAG: hypothetical protein V7604_3471, partial [Hyphomicrobiales bacterium]
MTNSGRIWRTLTLLARLDMAAGIAIAVALLVLLAG